jgi:hypothetical protein
MTTGIPDSLERLKQAKHVPTVCAQSELRAPAVRHRKTFPATVTEAAALFERLAQPLYDGDDFTVIEHAIELWKGGEGQLPAAKEWAARMAAALKRIAAP